MHHSNIYAADFSESIHIIISDFEWNSGCCCNDFNFGRRATRFFNNPAKNGKFKKIQVVSMNMARFKIGPFIL